VIRVLVRALQFLLWLLLLRILFRSLARAFSPAPARPAAPPPRAPVREVEDLVLDRVCRTHVPRSRALVARVEGREEHFCSPACRDKAVAAVARAS